ncbi:MAG: HD domain-containing protein [Eubacteriales bacterium]|nr:HD domain-containing protein [Eubacteriales bacterium]
MEITLNDVKNNETIRELVSHANKCLEVIGYTDHGPRHVGYVSRIAGEILEKLGMPERRIELAKIAGWVHDVGNMINRKNHGLDGAVMLFPILCEIGMPVAEVCDVCAAVGSHEEETGKPVSDISAALILADKIDAHRARVRVKKFDLADIHDRVNYSIQSTKLTVQDGTIAIDYNMSSSSSPMDFLMIYLTRMQMCEKSAEFLGCNFGLYINGVKLNRWEEPDGV